MTPSGEIDRHADDGGAGTGPQLREFLAILAHEVNTPLSIAELAADSILEEYEDLEDHEIRELVERVARNVSLAMLLMHRMQLARDIELGTVDLELESVELSDVIRESVEDLRQTVLAEHPVTVATNGDLRVRADAAAAREILFNLLSNASKYSESDASIEVTADRTGDAAVVVIRDHGSGVTPVETDRIFEKYFQVDEDRPGVGLGLFVSRGLARAHGGDITVRPAADVGSEFRLELPVEARTRAST